MPNNLINPITAEHMIARYNEATNQISQAYKLLAEAKKLLDATFGDYTCSYHLIPGVYSEIDRVEKESLNTVKRKTWRRLLERLEINKVLPMKRLQTFKDKLDDKQATIPDVTLTNLFSLISDVVNNADALHNEFILEAYDILMRGRRKNRYKTNAKNARNALGKKVILTNTVDMRRIHQDKVRLSDRSVKELICIDRVFHLLDGKGVPSGYHSPLADAVDQSIFGDAGETDYFCFKAFKNGNLHLVFKRMDLVKKINLAANNGTNLPDHVM